ncbi:MAG: hypothetical protein MUO88_23970 [Desulfobacterales bacterium]|nr:hypothetical protein [Desulfobacterales bacterium]
MAETKVILYAKKEDNDAKRLQNLIVTLVLEKNIEISRSIKRLSKSLSHCLTHNTLVILLVANKEDLQELLAISDLLVDIRIILILPDDEKKTIAKGHRLYPRFISNITSDFKDVGAVLEKMLKTLNAHDSFLVKENETRTINKMNKTNL